MPKDFLSRLDELLYKKRPFGFLLSSKVLLSYIGHWSSLADLAEGFKIRLNLQGDTMLELWGDFYRLVSEWKRGGWEETK